MHPDDPESGRRWSIAILAVVVVFAVKTTILALAFTPLWDVPDEVAHYDYITDLAAGSLRPDGLDEIEDRLVDSWTDERERPVPNWIAGQHPPLYHLAAIPAYLLARISTPSLDTRVRIVRLFNVVLGSLTILLLFQVLSSSLGRHDFAFLVASSLSVTPMFTHLSAGVTHDVAVALGSTVVSWFFFRFLGTGSMTDLTLAAASVSVTGAIKVTAILLVPIIVIGGWLARDVSFWRLVLRGSAAGLIAALLPGTWILLVNVLQSKSLRSLDGISVSQILDFVSRERVIEETIRSFFGVLGWYGSGGHDVIAISGFVYMPFLLVTVATAVLSFAWCLNRRLDPSVREARVLSIVIPLAAVVLTMVLVFRGAGPVGFLKYLLVALLVGLGVTGFTSQGGDVERRIVMVSQMSIAIFLPALVLNSLIATKFWGALGATHGRYAYVILPFLVVGVGWGAFRWWIDRGWRPEVLLVIPGIFATTELVFLIRYVAPFYE